VKDLITRAKDVAEAELASMRGRLAHVSGVAITADKVVHSLLNDRCDEVVAAAWLHDVGYGPRVRDCGFHPLDGAVFLRSQGFPDVVASLVAFHSGAAKEADERGLAGALSQFAPAPNDLLEILTYADMTTGPAGETVTVEARIAEILDRYPLGNPVYRAVSRSAPELKAAVRRIENQLELALRHPR
jgi:HD superfamily phosphodiesterase